MSYVSLILYFFICFGATTLGAITGVGGGVIIKPVFDAVSGLPVATISFLSGCTVLAMTAVSVISSKKGDAQVDKKRGTLLAIGGAVGGVIGKQIFDIIKNASGDDGLIGVVQSILMILLTGGVLIYVLNKKRIKSHNFTNSFACLAIGLFLGILSAFLGIGGGPINLAVLYFFFSMDTKTAAVNSLYIILFSQITSLLSTIIRGSVPDFEVSSLVVMSLSGIVGGIIGRQIAKKLSANGMDKVFDVLLVVITCISCYNLVRYAMMM